MEEVISKELLSDVFTDNQQDFEVVGMCPDDKRLLEYIWIQELPDYYTGEAIKKVPMRINIHKLAIKIVDKMITLGYVASLTKIKGHWWCEFATENWYKNNGIMCYGNMNGKNDIDTKSDDVLSCAVKAYQWILEKKV